MKCLIEIHSITKVHKKTTLNNFLTLRKHFKRSASGVSHHKLKTEG